MTDPIDATVVLLAAPGDRIMTSDPHDITRLAAAAGNRPVIITRESAWPGWATLAQYLGHRSGA